MEEAELTPDTLTSAQFEQVKRFIEEATFEIELEGDDIVLSVDHQPEEIEGTSLSYGETVASVGIRTVVGAFVTRQIGSTLDPQEARAELLAMAGRLREAAKFLENHAESLSEEDWGMNTSPRLQLIEYEEEGESDNIESEKGAESTR
jgi:hypothetical protein